jgi:GNAT superfamily N-acetyltransferase
MGRQLVSGENVGNAAKEAVRNFGWLNAALYFAARGLSILTFGAVRIVKYYVVAQPVPAKPLLPSGARTDLLIVRTFAGDRIVADFPRPPEVVAWRFSAGGLCFTARKGDRFVGFLWLHDRPYEEDEVRCLFVPKPEHRVVWDYDVYVDPEYRGGRAFVRLWDTAYDYLRARDVRWSMSRISAFNPGSLAAHERMGARRLATAVFLCIGSLQIMSSTTGPYLHVSWSKATRPTLVLLAPDDCNNAKRNAGEPQGAPPLRP